METLKESKMRKEDINTRKKGASVEEGNESKEVGCDEGSVELDESLYSRQLFVYGDVASRKLATASVLICGLGGVGVEVAKNVILTGVREVVLHDPEPAKRGDLATQFYLTEADLGKNRALACVGRLAQLNPNVTVTTTNDPHFCTPGATTVAAVKKEEDATSTSKRIYGIRDYNASKKGENEEGSNASTTDTTIIRNSHQSGLTTELLKKFTVVVLTESTLEEQVWVDSECRRLGVRFIVANAKGLCGQVFCDFGNRFYVADPTDREVASFPIMDITSEAEESVLTVPPKMFHGLQDGDHITFSGIRGMTALNGTTRQVKVLDGQRVMIGSTVNLGEYMGGGAGHEVREGRTFTHQPLSCTMSHPSIVPLDFNKPGRGILLHLAFLALHHYITIHAAPPRPWHRNDADTFLSLCHHLRQEGFGWEENEESEGESELDVEQMLLLQLFSYTASGAVAGIVSVVGGVAAGEVVKACARRFSPLTQFLYFDALECLPQGSSGQGQVLNVNIVPRRNRYDGMASVIGWDVVEELLKMQYNGIEWTDWDKFEIEGDMTLCDLIDFFRLQHNLQLTMVSSGNFTLHSDFLPAHEKERRKKMRITEILKELIEEDEREWDKGETSERNAKTKIGPVIILDICADDQKGEDVDVPFIRLFVGKDSEEK